MPQKQQQQLEPTVKETIHRLRSSAQKIQKNGKEPDPETMGSIIADISYLLATFFEAQPVTLQHCEYNKQEVKREIIRELLNNNKSKGLNWPTAATIIGFIISITSIIITVSINTS